MKEMMKLRVGGEATKSRAGLAWMSSSTTTTTQLLLPSSSYFFDLNFFRVFFFFFSSACNSTLQALLLLSSIDIVTSVHLSCRFCGFSASSAVKASSTVLAGVLPSIQPHFTNFQLIPPVQYNYHYYYHRSRSQAQVCRAPFPIG